MFLLLVGEHIVNGKLDVIRVFPHTGEYNVHSSGTFLVSLLAATTLPGYYVRQVCVLAKPAV